MPRAIEYAKVLAVPRLNCLVGKRVPGRSDEEHWQTLVQNARFAATELAKHGLELLVEPINHYDIPGFFLNRTYQALKLLDEIGQPNVRVQYDIYHAQRTEGNLAQLLRQHFTKINHIQIADNPGRHQPGTGEINFPFLFAEIDKLGYRGYVGCEYVPNPGTLKSLKWIEVCGGKLA